MADAAIPMRRANTADIGGIMEVERQPGFELFVGRSSADFHASVIDDPDYCYLVGLAEDGQIGGVAILRDLTNAQGNTSLKRFAVRAPGKGFGTRFLRQVTVWVFENTRTHRFWLDHIITNDRARHVYERVGFQREGILRQAYVLPDGTRTDLAVMSILRPEWLSHKD